MKHLSCVVLLAATLAAQATAADVGVSVSISEPGFYGQIHIGDLPRPRVIYAQPVIIRRMPRREPVPAIYVHVPPGHAKHWSKHCAKYDACDRPVYFVRDDWYDTVYVPSTRRHDDDDRGNDQRGEDRGSKKK